MRRVSGWPSCLIRLRWMRCLPTPFGIAIDGPTGLISRMIKAVLERGLDVEMADHLGYDRGDPAGQGSGNSRNGFTSRTVITSAG